MQRDVEGLRDDVEAFVRDLRKAGVSDQSVALLRFELVEFSEVLIDAGSERVDIVLVDAYIAGRRHAGEDATHAAALRDVLGRFVRYANGEEAAVSRKLRELERSLTPRLEPPPGPNLRARLRIASAAVLITALAAVLVGWLTA